MSVPTSLGRMLDPYTHADTISVLSGMFSGFPGMVTRGNPWIDSPIFDRLAGERFGK